VLTFYWHKHFPI